MIILLKGEIRYGNTSLYDAFTGAAGKLEGKYREFFLNTAEDDAEQKRGKPFGEIFRSCAQERPLDDCRILHQRRKGENLYSLGERLGYLGMDMQLRQLRTAGERIWKMHYRELQ